MKKTPPVELLWVVGVFLAGCGFVLWRMLGSLGQVVYPIDDPYIHMAMARHWVEHGVYGVSLDGFSSSSSSPLWTLLVAFCFRVIGVQDWIPLALNGIASLLILILLHRILRQWISHRLLLFAMMLFIVISLPLWTQSFTGMEHPLHMVFLLLWVPLVFHHLSNPEVSGRFLFLLAMCAVLTRYESVFVASAFGLLLCMNHRWKALGCVLAGTFLPVLLLGGMFVWQGWNFFPNSIVVKSAFNTPEAHWLYGVATRLYHQIYTTPHLAVLWIGSLPLLFWRMKNPDWIHEAKSCWLFVFVVSVVLHGSFASIGWFYRYEGYLLLMGLVALFSHYPEWKRAATESVQPMLPRMIAYSMQTAMVILAASPFYPHWTSVGNIVPGAKNIYEQQYQMGRFLQKYYEEKAVLANDIGAVNYLADIVCLDLMGIGSMEPLKAARQGRFNAQFASAWGRLKGADIAVIYTGWWNEAVPKAWRLIATWTVPEKVTVSQRTVSFYALHPEAVEPLAARLAAFQEELPQSVQMRLYYPE